MGIKSGCFPRYAVMRIEGIKTGCFPGTRLRGSRDLSLRIADFDEKSQVKFVIPTVGRDLQFCWMCDDIGMDELTPGKNGLPRLRISTPAATAEIYLHGAQVTSWQPAGAEEVIFLSRHSHWEDGRAIRGGIPVCFPWFRGKADDPKAPAHGFVRTRE